MSGTNSADDSPVDPFEPMPFAVTVSSNDRCTTVHVAGELDLSTAPLLAAAFDGLVVAEAGCVEVDLTDLEFVDVAGSRPLQRAAAFESAAGRRLRVSGMSPRVERLLAIIGLTALVDIA